jgi:hypothetical protein
MQAWLAAHGFAREDLEGQQRYMAHEAMHDYSRSRNSLMNAMDPIAAGDVVERDFERPRILNNRHQAFRYAYSAAGNQRVTITATPGGNVVTLTPQRLGAREEHGIPSDNILGNLCKSGIPTGLHRC